jgi:YspA, cpYpsA-related SLOG family
MKTIICGGRDYRLTKADIGFLDSLLKQLPITEVVSGTASGADSDGELWAEKRGITVQKFLPLWKKYGAAAGPMRNTVMAEYADAVIAFPGGKGTADMVNKAVVRKLKVYDCREGLKMEDA